MSKLSRLLEWERIERKHNEEAISNFKDEEQRQKLQSIKQKFKT